MRQPGRHRVATQKGNVAGILGIMEEGSDSNVDDCWNSGEIKHDHDSDNGGIVGYVDHRPTSTDASTMARSIMEMPLSELIRAVLNSRMVRFIIMTAQAKAG